MAKTASRKVPVSTRALIQRINRKLLAEEQAVRASRGGRAELELGDYYILNLRFNSVDAMHVNLEELGREVGALRPHEEWDAEGAL